MSGEIEAELPEITWNEAALKKEGKLWKPKIFHLGRIEPFSEYFHKLSCELQTPSRDFLASDGALIPFDVSLSSSFDWSVQIQLLDKLQALGKKAFIYLDFGFGKNLSSLKDSGIFMSLGVGIDQLSDKVLSKHKQAIEAAFLTWNAKSFAELVSWTPTLERDFYDSLTEAQIPHRALSELLGHNLSSDARFYLELFSKELVTNYLNFLITQLPADLAAFVHFSSSEHLNFDTAPLRLHYLFERRSMGSAFLAWSETLHEKTAGIYCGPYGEMPLVESDDEVAISILLPELKQGLAHETLYIDALKKLRSQRLNARCIPSEVFHEEWHLIDQAVGASAALTYEAFRQLVGFSVSGGRFFYLDMKSPHLDDEVQESFSQLT